MIQSLNPATGKLLRSFDRLTPDALHAKIALASTAARTYPSESLDQRIFWMRRLSALLEADIEELASLMTAEMGKTLTSARAEVRKCALVCRYYADNAPHMLAPEFIASDDSVSPKEDRYIRYLPLGVILAVMPWNFPFWQVFRFAAPALMAGNVGLLKHASNVPQCALAIEALIRRAGFPRGSFQTLLIDASQVETILADDRIAAVTVTGSEAAGRAIAAQAGWLIKKSVLELGGSDPFIVMPSAHLDDAVAAAVQSRTLNNGQSCIAAKRFFIHEDIYDDFERRFTYGMAALKVGDPTLPTTDIGPLATPQIVEELLAQVAAAKSAGGRILTGGSRSEDQPTPNFFQPTVIAGVNRSAAICKQEIFGPVALIFRIGSLEEAVALANDTPFGLAASAWTTDSLEQQRLSTELQCGAVFFNKMVASEPSLPFGGIKRSGYGRELSAYGMREFLNAKTIVVAAVAAPKEEAAPVIVSTPPPPVAAPTEFSQIASQLRNFESNKPAQRPAPPIATVSAAASAPSPEAASPAQPPVRAFGNLKLAPLVWDAPSDRPQLAPIVLDSVPEPRRLAPIVLDSDPEPPRKLPPLVFGNPDDRSDDDDNDGGPVRGSVLGLH
jgi:succinate-semialdehyde dehydrogenase/glutarate-semialdehyde dehydrogenase